METNKDRNDPTKSEHPPTDHLVERGQEAQTSVPCLHWEQMLNETCMGPLGTETGGFSGSSNTPMDVV